MVWLVVCMAVWLVACMVSVMACMVVYIFSHPPLKALRWWWWLVGGETAVCSVCRPLLEGLPIGRCLSWWMVGGGMVVCSGMVVYNMVVDGNHVFHPLR